MICILYLKKNAGKLALQIYGGCPEDSIPRLNCNRKVISTSPGLQILKDKDLLIACLYRKTLLKYLLGLCLNCIHCK